MRTLVLWSLVLGIAGLVPFAQACDQGFEAFKTTVYAKVIRDCAVCHNGTNPKAPPFATADMLASYNQLASYMNFSNVEESMLVIRAGNDHCNRENCNDASGVEMQALAQQWVDNGEKLCERNGRYFTAEVMIPSDLPKADEGFKAMNFDLGQVRPEQQGLTFQIEMQNFMDRSDTTRGMYRFRSPRVLGGNKSIYLKDVKVLLNGKYDVIYNAYTSVDRTIPFFMQKGEVMGATPTLSAESLLILKDGLQSQKLSISFVEIDARNDVAACVNADGFTQKVMPVLQSNNCASCHSSMGGSVAEKTFDCTLPATKLCGVASALVDPKFFMVSPLVLIPSQGLLGHPTFTEAQRYAYVQALKTWLNK